MSKRIAVIAALFGLATVATVLVGRWFPAPLTGPAAAVVVTALGALLIGLAPAAPGATVHQLPTFERSISSAVAAAGDHTPRPRLATPTPSNPMHPQPEGAPSA